MDELKELYSAIKERILEMQDAGYPNNEIEIELRLDIENCIDLLFEELSIKLDKNSTD